MKKIIFLLIFITSCSDDMSTQIDYMERTEEEEYSECRERLDKIKLMFHHAYENNKGEPNTLKILRELKKKYLQVAFKKCREHDYHYKN